MKKYIKHVPKRGECKTLNIDLEHNIEQFSFYIKNNITINPETDRPITSGKIKGVLKKPKTSKQSGSGVIFNEILNYSSNLTITA